MRILSLYIFIKYLIREIDLRVKINSYIINKSLFKIK